MRDNDGLNLGGCREAWGMLLVDWMFGVRETRLWEFLFLFFPLSNPGLFKKAQRTEGGKCSEQRISSSVWDTFNLKFS